MRTEQDLKHKLTFYHQHHFPEVEIKNKVSVKFGKRAKRQLGSIRHLPDGSTLITITGLFRDPQIPDFVLEETLVHEFIHYVHGFNSPLNQAYQYPHKHGIMRKEFETRNLLSLYLASKKWLKANWAQYLKDNNLLPKRRVIRRVSQPKTLRQLIRAFRKYGF
ncbi:hypothetical protein KKC60_05310 [Patescibacteria group bacterium]|nr:hypothetical protein [Patescibacteria group bacterium]